MSNSVTQTLERLLEIQRQLELRKALYVEYDKLLLELAAGGFASELIDGLLVTLKDNFASGNTGWTSAAVRRYDLEVKTPEQIARAEHKAKKALGALNREGENENE